MRSKIQSNDSIDYYYLDQQAFIFVLFSDQKIECTILNSLEELEEYIEKLNLSKVVEIKLIKPQDFSLSERSLQKISKCSFKVVDQENAFEVIFNPIEGKIKLSGGSGRIKSNTPHQKKKVLIIDDSKTIIKLLTKIINDSEDLEVVGHVMDPRETEQAIDELNPDVITLDVHMPYIDGLTLLKKIFPKYQLPILMISRLSIEEGPMIISALENGAFDYIQKPEFSDIQSVAPIIHKKLVNARKGVVSGQANLKNESLYNVKVDENSLLAIGASTGGTVAIQKVLTMLPEHIPPIVIVQHIPKSFSKALADRLNELCPFRVKEAEQGDVIEADCVYIAPGDQHMKIIKQGGGLAVQLTDDEPLNYFRPSVDYMFNSLLELKDKKIVATILTGMC